uniref:Mannosyltransferase n=1 Tax=Macrostomum lignano TaxID=282301 RepID=A0A1I8JSC0_9PLAT
MVTALQGTTAQCEFCAIRTSATSLGQQGFTGSSRHIPSACQVGDLPEIHALCISHNHMDHMDEKTLKELAKKMPNIQCFVPAGDRMIMQKFGFKDIQELKWWQAAEETVKGLSVTFTPASHWSGRGAMDRNCSLWGSFVLQFGQHSAFFAGDTGYQDRIFKDIEQLIDLTFLGQNFGPFSLSAIPIGCYEPREVFSVQHACPSEAVIIHQEVRSKLSVGIHWGAFRMTTREPPEDLREAMEEARQRRQNVAEFRTIKVGEKICWPLPPAAAHLFCKFCKSTTQPAGHERCGGNSLSAAASAGRCSHASAYVRSRASRAQRSRRSGQQAGAGESLLGRLWWGPEATKEDRDAAIEPSETVGPEPLRRSLLTASAACSCRWWRSAAPTPCCCTRTLSAFGYGHLTWEWQAGLRSPLYPGAFALLFKLLQLAGADSRLAVAKLPRLLQACLAAVADFYLYRFSRRVAAAAQWALICQLLNWFTLYTAPRTLSNCVEWLLTTVGLYYYPWPEAQSRKAQWKFALAVAAACALRPTSAVPWLMLCLWHAARSRRRLGRLLALYGATGLLVLAVSGLADKHYYGRWTLSQLNFLHYNLLSDIGSFYGVHPWHWYITQGIPAILGPHLPLYLYASYQSWRQRRRVETALTLLVIWTLYVYSHAPPHPAASWPTRSSASCSRCCADDAPVRPLPQRARPRPAQSRCCLPLLPGHPAALYFCLIHQRGPLDAVNHLGKDAELRLTRTGVPAHLDPDLHFLFLAPCHSTPLYSHLHSNVSTRTLDCSPNWRDQPGYVEEQEAFYSDPAGFASRLLDTERRPSHILLFDSLLPRLRGLLETRGFTLRKKFFNSHFEDGRRSHYLLLFCRSDWV